MKRFIVALFLTAFALSAFALPSVDDVQSEIAKGNYVKAEQMMREVVAARPDSARARYVYAEILAHDRRFDLAAEELARARKIDPDLKFTQPEKFNEFARLIEREQASARRPVATDRPVSSAPTAAVNPAMPAASGDGVPMWVWLLGLVAVAAIAWRAFGARRTAPAAAMAGGSASWGGGTAAAGMPPAPGYGPYPPQGQAPGAGSGLLGTGLAVAGGLAAGVLAEKLIEGHRGSSADNGSSPLGNAPSNSNAGLFDIGPDSDNAAARELEQRQVDFGSGDGWGGSDSGGGSSDDSGGW
jgi:hypothetical protein